MKKVFWFSNCWDRTLIIDYCKKHNPDELSFGSESCLLKVPSNQLILSVLKEIYVEKVNLITPYLNNDQLLSIKKQIQDLLKKLPKKNQLVVVVNDWGFLYALQKLIEFNKNKLSVELGINLSGIYPIYTLKKISPLFELELKRLGINSVAVELGELNSPMDLKYIERPSLELTLYEGDYQRIVLGRNCFINKKGICKKECFNLQEIEIYKNIPGKKILIMGNDFYVRKNKLNLSELLLSNVFSKIVYNIIQ